MASDSSNSTSWLKRYFSAVTLVVIAGIAYMIFFSDTSIMKKIEYQQVIDSLEHEVAVTRDSIEYYKDLNRRLTSDPEVMEQVVREQHNMKRADEDVYVFTD
jgi:hypothetical protein